MKSHTGHQPLFAGGHRDFDPAHGELVATSSEQSDLDAEYETITRKLYVTENRKFFVIEQFYAFDGRPASNTRPMSPDQARAWCGACGLDARLVDRYVAALPQACPASEVGSLLSQPWGAGSGRSGCVA